MPSQAQRDETQRRRSYVQGLLLLLVVVILWTASNFLTNALLTTGGYDKPFFVTYANTSSFVLYLVPYIVSSKLRARWVNAGSRVRRQEDALDEEVKLPRWLTTLGFDVPSTPAVIPDDDLEAEQPDVSAHRGRRHLDADSSSTPLLSASRPTSPIRPFLAQSPPPVVARPSSIDGRRPRSTIPMPTISAALKLSPLTFRETAVLAAQFTLVWFGANWAINAGLGLTSVASGTTIGSASGFFTLALGAILGVDRFTLARLGAVCVSAVGVFAVTYADSGAAAPPIPAPGPNEWLTRRAAATYDTPPNAPVGDVLALLSAFLYSLYVMLLKTRIGSEDRISMPLMFGIVGFINLAFLWPVIPLLHYTGVEPFALPPSRGVWAAVLVNMSITFVSDFIYLLAMLKSSPLITTLGLSLTIPLAVVIDAVRGTHSGGALAALGSTLVLSSFAFIALDDHKTFQRQKRSLDN